MKTALNATRLAIAAFIIPYIFAYSPALLFIDTNAIEVVQIVMTSFGGMFGVAAGLEGFMFRRLNPFMRVIAIGGGLLMIIPGLVTDLVGVGILVLLIVMQFAGSKNKPSTLAS